MDWYASVSVMATPVIAVSRRKPRTLIRVRALILAGMGSPSFAASATTMSAALLPMILPVCQSISLIWSPSTM